MRLSLLTIAFPLLLTGCSKLTQPEVMVAINSDKTLSVKDFEHSPATEYSSCQVSGTMEFDIAVKPQDFTGTVYLKGVKIKYADMWTRTEDSAIIFVGGKQYDGTGIGNYTPFDASKAEKEAICKTKSSSDIKLVSLGEALFAVQGIKAAVSAEK